MNPELVSGIIHIIHVWEYQLGIIDSVKKKKLNILIEVANRYNFDLPVVDSTANYEICSNEANTDCMKSFLVKNEIYMEKVTKLRKMLTKDIKCKFQCITHSTV